MNTQYTNISDLLSDSPVPKSLRKDVDARIASRQIIKRLMAMRADSDMSQTALAKKIGCSQSRISKLESGTDNDLRFGDFHGYLSALDFNAEIHVLPVSRTPQDEVEFFLNRAGRVLRHLVGLAHTDEKIAESVAGIVGDAMLCFMGIAKDSADGMPRKEDETPYIHIEVLELRTEELESSQTTESGKRHEDVSPCTL